MIVGYLSKPPEDITSFAGRKWLEEVSRLLSQGHSVYRNLDLDETGVLIKAAQGRIYGWEIHNEHASAKRYVKLYNKATAPTVGTDTPVLTVPVAAGQSLELFVPGGIAAFADGLGIGATTGVADADTGAPGANEVIVNILYR